MEKKIYLASASPRRKELLELAGLEFEVIPLDGIDENELMMQYGGEILGLAEFLAGEKAKAALRTGIQGLFITADTIVVSDDGAVLGKPKDRKEAFDFLCRLAGNWHTVATGVAIAESSGGGEKGRIESGLEATRVKFGAMNDREIESYIETGEPFDKAGGYGIQGRASIYIERIEGCYFNVVGFPLYRFWGMWKKFITKRNDGTY